MTKNTSLSAAVAALFVLNAGVASAELKVPKTKYSLEKCMAVALAKHAGEVETLEMEISEGKPHYEFDIKGADGFEYEVEVSALTGKILEEEIEVPSAEDPTFKAKAKVSETDAAKAALAKFSGVIDDVEYSIEEDGVASYEFDIKMLDGKEIEVEVDAATGKVLEHEVEVYQIGGEE